MKGLHTPNHWRPHWEPHWQLVSQLAGCVPCWPPLNISPVSWLAVCLEEEVWCSKRLFSTNILGNFLLAGIYFLGNTNQLSSGWACPSGISGNEKSHLLLGTFSRETLGEKEAFPWKNGRNLLWIFFKSQVNDEQSCGWKVQFRCKWWNRLSVKPQHSFTLM